jgi:CHAT domain-containing protein
VIHLAAHGRLEGDDAMNSFIVLAPGGEEDGYLHASEIRVKRLNAGLVVLSACQSGEGRTELGEGVLGLSWALFIAGTPSSVLSQWQVASDSTTALMGAFYARVHPEREPPEESLAVALQQAQLDLMRSNARYAHPFYWAAFFQTGDWRNPAAMAHATPAGAPATRRP